MDAPHFVTSSVLSRTFLIDFSPLIALAKSSIRALNGSGWTHLLGSRCVFSDSQGSK